LFLALDQGGSASRAVLFDVAGAEVASAHVPIATHRAGADHVEHDADELSQSLSVAARDACESPPAQGRPIIAAGLATQRSTIACWDREDGAALSPAISWQDRRHAAWLREHLGAREAWVRELTGLPLSPHYGASKLRWCLDELAPVRLALRDARLAAGPLSSFLLHRLCVERPVLADPANASRTLLYDPATLDWSAPLLQAFGIPAGILPDCVGTQHDFGTLEIDAGRRVPVRACSGDQSAAVFAFGTPAPTTAFVNVGTGAFVQRALATSSAGATPGLLRSVLHAQSAPAHAVAYSLEGTVNGAGSAIDWLARRNGLDMTRALQTLPAVLDASLATLLFVNGVGGLGAPFWLPDFPTLFVRAVSPHLEVTEAAGLQQLAAVVESISFLIAVNVDAMQRVAPLARLVVTGGLANCGCLCQSLADATGLLVERPALREATARGIAFLAAGRPSDWRPVPVEQRFPPTGQPAVRERFERWRVAMALHGAAV
jgi:glycerol kinase